MEGLITDPLAFTGALVKVIRLSFYPGNKACNARVGQKRRNMIIGLCEFGLC